MNLKRLVITILADGVRLIDKGSGIQEGTGLVVRYFNGNDWIEKEVRFEREPRMLFHPFRRSMFIYTGARPVKVLVRLSEYQRKKARRVPDREAFFEEENFSSFPEFGDSSWSDESYDPFFFEPAPSAPPEETPAPGAAEAERSTTREERNIPPAVEQPAPPVSAPGVISKPVGDIPPIPQVPPVPPVLQPAAEVPSVEREAAPVERIDPGIPAIDTTGAVSPAAPEFTPSEGAAAPPVEETPEAAPQSAGADQEPNAY